MNEPIEAGSSSLQCKHVKLAEERAGAATKRLEFNVISEDTITSSNTINIYTICSYRFRVEVEDLNLCDSSAAVEPAVIVRSDTS